VSSEPGAGHLDVFTAAIAAFVVATFVNYVLSRGLAFRSKRAASDELVLLFMLSMFAFLLNLGAFTVLYAMIGLDSMIAKVIGTGVGLVLNYGFRQLIIFSPQSLFPALSNLRSVPVVSPVQTQSDLSNYAGHRVLDAMRSAPRYAGEVYAQVRSACRPVAGPILDFGAGDGVFAESFLRDGVAVDCVEPDAANQASLRELGLTVVADIRAVTSNRYCVAYSINVLEHLHQPDWYLAELHRVLRPGGTLFVFVPAFDILWTSLDDEVEHVQRFSRRTLAGVLAQAGFELESLRYFDSLGFVAALAVRLLEKFGLFRYWRGSVGLYDKAIFPLSRLCDHCLANVVGKNLIAVSRKSGAKLELQPTVASSGSVWCDETVGDYSVLQRKKQHPSTSRSGEGSAVRGKGNHHR
jgi:putative flippase GtrA/SAM-dependent methyltransferase